MVTMPEQADAKRLSPRRASISDVARHAGVSLGTVSNVLNRPDRVSVHTRDRVLAAIEELSFIPNGSARQLRAGTITTVGAILLDIGNPFFTEVARGIEDRLALDDYTLMLASSDGEVAREARYLRLFEEHGVLGMLVTPAGPDIGHLLDLRGRGLGIVLLDQTSPSPDISSVAVDDVAGAAMAVRHLLELGHREIGFINGGYMVCSTRLFDYLEEDPCVMLEQEPLRRMASEGRMGAFKHNGFWQPMDTFQEFTLLNGLWNDGRAPWKVW